MLEISCFQDPILGLSERLLCTQVCALFAGLAAAALNLRQHRLVPGSLQVCRAYEEPVRCRSCRCPECLQSTL